MKETVQFTNYSSDDTIAGEVSSKFHEWNSYRDPQLKLWAEIDAYIHGTENGAFNQNFDHKTFIPVISEIHEDLKAIMYSTLFPHDDWLGWKPFDQEASTVQKRKTVLSYIKHAHALNGFSKVARTLIDDFIRYGNAFAQVVHVNNSVQSPEGAVTPGYIGPEVKRISPFDIVFNPTADKFEESPKIIKKLMSTGAFLGWVESLKNNGTNVSSEAVERILSARNGSSYSSLSTTRKNTQFEASGFNTIESYYTSGYVEVLWFYGSVFDRDTQSVYNDRCIVVVDQDVVLFNEYCEDPCIYKAGWKDRPDNLWSQGSFDNIVGMNFMINHRENAKNDAIDRMIYPDRLYVGEVDEVYDETTRQMKYISPEGGSVQDIPIDSSVLSFNTEIDMHEQRARRAARLPQQLAGFRTPGEKTAFEVQNLDSGAFRGFINKAEQIEIDLFAPAVGAEIKKARENIQSVITVANQTEDKLYEFLEITPEDLNSNGKLVPHGSSRFARLLQQQAGISQLSQSPVMQAIAPHTSTWKLAEAVSYVYGFNDFDVFKKFAAIEEQVEQQQFMNNAEQEMVASTEQRTPEEFDPDEMMQETPPEEPLV